MPGQKTSWIILATCSVSNTKTKKEKKMRQTRSRYDTDPLPHNWGNFLILLVQSFRVSFALPSHRKESWHLERTFLLSLCGPLWQFFPWKDRDYSIFVPFLILWNESTCLKIYLHCQMLELPWYVTGMTSCPLPQAVLDRDQVSKPYLNSHNTQVHKYIPVHSHSKHRESGNHKKACENNFCQVQTSGPATSVQKMCSSLLSFFILEAFHCSVFNLCLTLEFFATILSPLSLWALRLAPATRNSEKGETISREQEHHCMNAVINHGKQPKVNHGEAQDGPQQTKIPQEHFNGDSNSRQEGYLGLWRPE